MALRLRDGRSKSTSDILDETVHNEEYTSLENSFRVENRYGTYTYEDFEEKRERFSKNTDEREKDRCARKSQSFVRKLIASLERKNEACKADDEFLTRYYKRNDYSNPNTDYSTNMNHQCSRKVKSEREMSNLEKNYSKEEDHRKNANFKVNVFPKNGIPVYPKVDLNSQLKKKTIYGCSSRKENDAEIIEENRKYCNKNSVKIDVRENSRLKHIDEEKNCDDSSSFDPNRSRVNLENRMDSANSYFLNGNKDDGKRDTIERIFIKPGEEETPRNGTLKKKVSRNRSFQNFFGSMIKWKKSEQERPRRYMSCDHLFKGSETSGAKSNKKLSRTTSFQAMVFQHYEEEDSTQNAERKATIRPIYGGKRSEQHLEDFARKKENRKYFVTEENANDLGKPSTIRDIAKHMSRLPQMSRINDCKDVKVPVLRKKIS